MAEIIVTDTADPGAAALKPAPVAIVDDFLPAELALGMRADIDAHFANPHRHRTETHQVWNYWYVPELYTYLRTDAEKVIARDRVETFMRTLREWTIDNLGMGKMSRPTLSLYVSGCRQGWHNDSGNGRFAFVYSLTRDERGTSGGETLVMRDGDGLRNNMTKPAAGRGLYEAVAPKFNRLVIFDDRVPHAVERVEGVMDPVEGRFVMHGHIMESGTHVTGALPLALVSEPIDAALRGFAGEASGQLARYQGPLSLRLSITAAGEVEACDVMIDRVLHPARGNEEWEPLREQLCEQLEAVRFPAASGETKVILPVMFGTNPAAIRGS
jgi:Rps23 Pro-64 3,4-dihydroxylase Tpa1-like proline 4-hydroxylase